MTLNTRGEKSHVAEPEEVFEITDFTDASEWEKFISGLEEVILAWGLHAKSLDELGGARVWKEQTETISFAGFPFVLSHHWLAGNRQAVENTPTIWHDMVSVENDFPSIDLHPVYRWYGVTNFVTIHPEGGQTIQNEGRIKLLLSSINVALHNTKCLVPVFLQVYQRWQNCFCGVFLHDHVRTDFEIIHLKKIPKPCCYLSGLVDMFKAKLNVELPNPVEVSIRFAYSVSEGLPWEWPEEHLNHDDIGSDFDVKRVAVLPFGASSDPVEKVSLFCTWPHLSEESVVDSEVFSDLNPSQAPVWKIKITFKEDQVGLLSEAIGKYLSCCKRKESVKNILGKNYKPNPNSDEKDYGSALGSLTDSLRVSTRIANTIPLSAVTSIVQRHQQRKEEGPLDEDVVTSLLYFLFPDANDEFSTEFAYGSDRFSDMLKRIHADNARLSDTLGQLKSAPVDSLTWRIASVLLYLLRASTDFRVMSYVWQEIVLELRYRYIHGHLMPGLSEDGPNHGFSLFHQKLQMLNCCIKRRKIREQELISDVTSDKDQPELDKAVSSDSDDEFYDAIEEQETRNGKPDGRKAKHDSLKLLKTGEPLYIPLMQDVPPLTEDMLELQTSALLELGGDSQGSDMRAKMMSSSLQSDMEAFKAANPGAGLEDFIRWYSPRDWVEDESILQKGKLSQRMEIPGNIWLETWRNCRVIPARRQRRLFDDTKEAEKILDFFFHLLPGQALTLLLPVVFHSAILRLFEEPATGITQLGAMLTKTVKKVGRALQSSAEDLDSFEEILHLFTWCENSLSRRSSVEQKFNYDGFLLPENVQEMLNDGATVEIGAISKRDFGKAVQKLFEDAQREKNLTYNEETNPRASSFGNPEEREFVLRTTASRPTTNSTPGPQRMYCSFRVNEVRIAGAFSQDTCFR